MKAKEIPPIWATACDRFGDPSEVLTGSREGLVYLRGKIDEALAKGEAELGQEARFDFEKISVSDTHPSRTLKLRPVLDRVVGFSLLGLILVVIGLAIYGAHAIFADLSK
jgi:hypothetical protein